MKFSEAGRFHNTVVLNMSGNGSNVNFDLQVNPPCGPHNKHTTPDSAGHSVNVLFVFLSNIKQQQENSDSVIHNKSYLNLCLVITGCGCSARFPS